MTYDVRCECGKSFAVSAADAGASFDCPCGREVNIPPLHVLRASVRSPETALAQLKAAALSGAQSGALACIVCGTATPDRARARIVYDRTKNSDLRPTPAEQLGCLLVGWLPALLLLFARRERLEEEALVVPVPVCAACRPPLADPNVLERALRAVPECAAVFKQYPNAEAALV